MGEVGPAGEPPFFFPAGGGAGLLGRAEGEIGASVVLGGPRPSTEAPGAP